MVQNESGSVLSYFQNTYYQMLIAQIILCAFFSIHSIGNSFLSFDLKINNNHVDKNFVLIIFKYFLQYFLPLLNFNLELTHNATVATKTLLLKSTNACKTFLFVLFRFRKQTQQFTNIKTNDNLIDAEFSPR